MAAYTPTRLLNPTQLPNSETTATPGLLTAAVAAATTWIVKQIVLCNNSAASVTCSLSIVPTGGTGQTANRIVNNVSLAVGETKFLDLSQVLVTGDFITGVASAASSVVCTISGLVVA